MKLRYDNNLNLVGLGVVPWARLGPENWFENYRIISLRDWDLHSHVVNPAVTVIDPEAPLSAKNVQSMVRDNSFIKLANNDFKSSYFLPYKPVEVDSLIAGRMLSNAKHFTSIFENKVEFRQRFKDKLNFAKFIISDTSALANDEAFESVSGKLGGAFVIQHESLSGGKGTYIVKSADDLNAALNSLPEGKIVLSALIEDAKERSIQSCATKYGVVTGQVQKQIIGDPQICNFTIPDARLFCGGEIGESELSSEVQAKIKESAKLVGEEMYRAGYKGIFGLDFLVKDNDLYVLEVNTRITGMTPVISALYRKDKDIPFYLLHILELGGFEYEIEDASSSIPQSGAQVILQAMTDKTTELFSTCESGVYSFTSQDGLKLVRRDARFIETDKDDYILVQSYVPVGSTIKPADRLITFFTRQPVLDSEDKLKDTYRLLISELYKRVKLV